jgi:hypothetical protein
MKKYVFTIKDDVCAANGKDIEATELIAKMQLWGSVEDYEKVIAAERAEYQKTADNLKAQLDAIKDRELTDDEFDIVMDYRDCKAKILAAYETRINGLEKQLEEVYTENKQRALKLAELFGFTNG